MEENKKEALKEAGPPSLSIDEKRQAYKRTKLLLEGFIGGGKPPSKQVARQIANTLKNKQLEREVIEQILDTIEKEFAMDKLFPNKATKQKVKRLEKIKNLL